MGRTIWLRPFVFPNQAMAFRFCGFIVFLCLTLSVYNLLMVRGIGKEENALDLSLDRKTLSGKLHLFREDGELDTKKRSNSAVVSTYTDDQMSKRRVRGGSDPIHNRNTELKELP